MIFELNLAIQKFHMIDYLYLEVYEIIINFLKSRWLNINMFNLNKINFFNYQYNILSFFNLNNNLNLFFKHFYIKIDRFSILFLILTFFIIIICYLLVNFLLYKKNFYLNSNLNWYFIIIFLISISLYFLFIIQDLIWFFIFFELSVMPLFFLLGIFGTTKLKINASTYLLYYTLFGSTFLIILIIFFENNFNTTNIDFLKKIDFNFNTQIWIFLCLFFSLLIKIPLFPFHIWLPKAHVESPTIGSVILAALILKISGFGIIRFLIPLTLKFWIYYKLYLMLFIIIGSIYCSLINLKQYDLKVIIAYSSIIHMSFAFLGLFTLTKYGILGAIILMLSHGLTSAILFILIGFLYDFYRQRIIFYYQGIQKIMPIFSFFLFGALLSNISFPGTFNFIGEILILFSLFQFNFLIGFLALFTTLINLIYSLNLYIRLCFGPLKINLNNNTKKIKNTNFIKKNIFKIKISTLFKNNILFNYSNFFLKKKNNNNNIFSKYKNISFIDLNYFYIILSIIFMVCIIYFGIQPYFILKFLM